MISVVKQLSDLWMRLEDDSPHVAPAATVCLHPLHTAPPVLPAAPGSPAAVPSPVVMGAMPMVKLICSPLPLQFLQVHLEAARS